MVLTIVGSRSEAGTQLGFVFRFRSGFEKLKQYVDERSLSQTKKEKGKRLESSTRKQRAAFFFFFFFFFEYL